MINLNQILNNQMEKNNLVGYQIGMQSHIAPSNRIVFMTNGIFLQRMIHSSEIF